MRNFPDQQNCQKIRQRRGLLLGAFCAFLALFLLFAGLALSTWLSAKDEQRQFDALAALVVSESAKPDDTPQSVGNDAEAAEPPQESANNENRFAALYERNPDFVGWLSIEGSELSYPVMCSPENPEYYLKHDFDGESSSSGVPFFGEGCDLSSNNIIIYGHNMKNGTMFSSLTEYTDEAYYEAHPIITFDTMEEDGSYQIIAAFRERVHGQSETGVFRYYNYGGDLTEEQFNDYLSNIRRHSLYDTGVAAEYGVMLLTLSTCAYHTENGRFVVVAKKLLT